MGRVIAIASQKGGVGKTTTAINLGASLAQEGRRVLLLDIDPQGNATSGLGVNGNDQRITIYEALIGTSDLKDAVMPTALANLDLIPAGQRLSGAEVELVAEAVNAVAAHTARAQQLIREVEIIPLEVVVRNVAAGSLSTRLGIDEGTALPRSIVEFYYKSDALGDPMVTEEHITAFGWATPQEIDDIMSLALRVNDFLSGLFLGVGIKLVDFKCEFGRLWENETMRIVLADEISPDCSRLWDIETQNKLDKDRFRRDMGGLVEAYQEVARRLGRRERADPQVLLFVLDGDRTARGAVVEMGGQPGHLVRAEGLVDLLGGGTCRPHLDI